MAKIIAVEDGLPDLKEILKLNGYQVVSPGKNNNADAVVVTGMDNNIMDIQNITTKAPVIDASGYTTDQILSRIREL
ncbi:MAG: hypothetical protein VR69_14450 [Peptococcaceae bacterium BRH_c4b]|nr:MAG: hypothetical protein VR69_14450 [Peptococcaceae bacterium BRH_c4b]